MRDLLDQRHNQRQPLLPPVSSDVAAGWLQRCQQQHDRSRATDNVQMEPGEHVELETALVKRQRRQQHGQGRTPAVPPQNAISGRVAGALPCSHERTRSVPGTALAE